jgi:PAS domain S-box-containing protein
MAAHTSDQLPEDARRYRELADALPQIACLASAAGVYEHVNPRFVEYADRTAEAWPELVHPDDLAQSQEEWSRAIIADRYSAELRLRRSDGVYRWFLVSASPLVRHDAQSSTWLVIVTDIHDRKEEAASRLEQARAELRLSEARFQGTLEHAPVAVAHNLPDGRFDLVNRAWCDLLGYTSAELLEKTWQDITHPDDLELDLTLARQAAAGEIPHYTMEKRYLHKDGTPVWTTLFGTFLRDERGEITKGVGVAIDITARRLAEERLAAIVSSISDYLVSFDREWRYTYVNDAVLGVLGKREDELLGRCIWDLYPASIGGDLYRVMHQAARERRATRAEHYYATWDKWFLSHIYPSSEGVTVYAIDITEQKHMRRALEESEARLRLALTATPLPLTIHAEDGEIVMINDVFTAVTGYTREEIRTTADWSERAYGERREAMRDVIDRLYAAEGPHHVGEFSIRTARGDMRVWDFSSAPLGRDARGRRLVLTIASDITDQRAAVAALRESEERHRALAAALGEADRRKDELLAMLAHELRNPLAPIQNAVGMLELIDAPDPAVVRSRELIARQLEHLVRMLDDLLDVSRITRGKIELERAPLTIASLVHEAVASVEALVESNGHTLALELAPDLVVEGDATRLVQVLVNLLANAAKFTRAGGTITVRAEPVDAGVRISVRDEGVGITETAQGRIFDLFVQEHVSLDRTRGGLGVGLTIVKRLVELHGGTVEVYSRGEGTGAEFVITLPRARSTATDASGASSAARDPRTAPLRIVIVEDNEDIAESYRFLLEHRGHDVRVAHDGATGLRLIEEVSPDLALLDLGLPVIDGLTLARKVRAKHPVRPMLVAISGYGRAEDKTASIEAGFDEHLTKPAKREAIEAAVERARKRREE